jgi:hypothetical protein
MNSNHHAPTTSNNTLKENPDQETENQISTKKDQFLKGVIGPKKSNQVPGEEEILKSKGVSESPKNQNFEYYNS